MSHDPQEFSVPVMFDVVAFSREEAGAAVAAVLVGHQLVGNRAPSGPEPRPHVEAWWTVEQVDKTHDRNDREAGVVVFEDDLDYLHALLEATDAADLEDAERHVRLLAYFARGSRVGTPDDRDADGY